jgi:uncharacterized protein GlcG (DUF336 family)
MLTLAAAETILTAALAKARAMALQPVAVVVLDARGALKAARVEDGTSLKRAEIATGKAHGALALGMGSRAIHKRVEQQPYFIAAVSHVVGGSLIPVPGGVLIKDAGGQVIGAIGISGDTSDNDEAAAVAGIAAAGLVADTGG